MSTATSSHLDEFHDIIERMDRIMNTSTEYKSQSVPSQFSKPLASVSQKLPCSSSGKDYIRVNIGIDEDLEMILDMDPSLIDPLPALPPPDKFLGWPPPLKRYIFCYISYNSSKIRLI